MLVIYIVWYNIPFISCCLLNILSLLNVSLITENYCFLRTIINLFSKLCQKSAKSAHKCNTYHISIKQFTL